MSEAKPSAEAPWTFPLAAIFAVMAVCAILSALVRSVVIGLANGYVPAGDVVVSVIAGGILGAFSGFLIGMYHRPWVSSGFSGLAIGTVVGAVVCPVVLTPSSVLAEAWIMLIIGSALLIACGLVVRATRQAPAPISYLGDWQPGIVAQLVGGEEKTKVGLAGPSANASGSQREADSTPAAPFPWRQVLLGLLVVLGTGLLAGLVWLYSGPEQRRWADNAITSQGGYVSYRGDAARGRQPAWFPKAYYDTVVSVGMPATGADALIDEVLWFRDVRYVTLANSDATPAALARLASLPSLEALDLENTEVDDACLAQLKRLPRLGRLSIQGDKSRVSDAGLAHIAEMTSLDQLEISGETITTAGLAELARLPRLQSLRLDGLKITDDSLAHVAQLPTLQRLTIHDSPITDDGLAHLSDLTQLEVLDLEGTQVRGEGLVHLQRMLVLGHLGLARTPVTDAGLAHLKHVPSVRWLDVRGTQVSDAGLDLIVAMPQIYGVNWEGSQISSAGIARLEAVWNSRMALPPFPPALPPPLPPPAPPPADVPPAAETPPPGDVSAEPKPTEQPADPSPALSP